jgi:hypothetical protein
MKKLYTLLISIVLLSIKVSAQEAKIDTVPNLNIYEDAASGLYKSKVIEVTGKSQKELSSMFKNWAAKEFVNLREITTSETESQIVLSYIQKTSALVKVLFTKSLEEVSWYVRLVAQFKDGKLRLQIYDEGNTFKPGGIFNGVSIPSVPARSYYIRTFTTKPTTFKEYQAVKGMYYQYHVLWQQSADRLLSSAETGVSKADVALKDDF